MRFDPAVLDSDRPIGINYGIQFRKGRVPSPLTTPLAPFFITPEQAYSALGGGSLQPPDVPYGRTLNPDEGDFRWYFGDEAFCEQKLDDHLAVISSLGMNFMRVVGIGPVIHEGELIYPILPYGSASFDIYISLLRYFLDKLRAINIRAILLLNAYERHDINQWSSNNLPKKTHGQWQSSRIYNSFLKDVCRELSGHSAFYGVDLYNEPAWLYPVDYECDRPGTPFPFSKVSKLLTSQWCAESFWSIKSVAPNVAVTMGLTHPGDVFEWDPSMLPLDFIAYHFYSMKHPLQHDLDNFTSMCHWARETTQRQWIIGETGYDGSDLPRTPQGNVDPSVKSEATQKLFLDASLSTTFNKGGKGYIWWTFSDFRMNDGGNDPFDYFGITNQFDPSSPQTSEKLKSAASGFSAGIGHIATPDNSMPVDYGNEEKFTQQILSGTVLDEHAVPVGNASIRAQVDGKWLHALSLPTGGFTLFSDVSTGPVWDYQVTKQGFTVNKVEGNQNQQPVVIKRLRNASWCVRWLSEDSGVIDCEWDSRDSWFLDTADSVAVGRFESRDYDSLLMANSGRSHWALFKFDGFWRRTQGEDALGNALGNASKFVSGDFDGDGIDELLTVNIADNSTEVRKLNRCGWKTVLHEAGTVLPGIGQSSLTVIRRSPNPSLLLTITTISSLAGPIVEARLLQLKQTSLGQFSWSLVDQQSALDLQWSGKLGEVIPYRNGLVAVDFEGSGIQQLVGTDLATGWVTVFEYVEPRIIWKDSNSGNPNSSLSQLFSAAGTFTSGAFDDTGREMLVSNLSGLTRFQLKGQNITSFSDPPEWFFPNHGNIGGFLSRFRTGRDVPDYLLAISKSSPTTLLAYDPI